MVNFRKIIIIHKAAIGDSVLATPVFKALKTKKPDLKLLYIGQTQINEFFRNTCEYLDDYCDINQGFFKVRKFILLNNPDLIIDLTNNFKTNLLTLGFKKSKYKKNPKIHAVNNFFETIDKINEITGLNDLKPDFPTLNPPKSETVSDNLPMIALVIGVGKKRSNRSWPLNKWLELIEKLKPHYKVVVIGGSDEIDLSSNFREDLNLKNFIGKLSLTQTASLLKECKVLISSDTGPLHIAVSVGTRVIGLYGPTLVERSGPFLNEKNCISTSDICKCINLKACSVKLYNGNSQCMDKIAVSDILNKINNI